MSDVSLDAIGRKHGTDKASLSHDYLSFYELFLAPLRLKQLTILEVGVFRGQSLKTWEEYFPNSRIIGVDISPESKKFKTPRVEIEIADQSDVQQMNYVALKHGPFDIIIEDGSHMWEHQITSLRALFPFVKPNGIYIVEDLQTNYGGMSDQYRGISSFSCVEYLKRWLDLRVASEQSDIKQIEDAFLRTYGHSIKHISFHSHACLIQKQWATPAGWAASQVLVEDELHVGSFKVYISAHVSNVGNVYFEDGTINLQRGRDDEIQGLLITTELGILEYKAQDHDGNWGDWVPEGTFVGSRGQSRFLRGLSVRTRRDMQKLYAVRSVGRFAGSSSVATASDGENLISDGRRALCALQIDLAAIRT